MYQEFTATPTLEPFPLSLQTNAFWHYQTLLEHIAAQQGLFGPEDLKANKACVNLLKRMESLPDDPTSQSIATGVHSRTLWHSLYHQKTRSAEFSFYLGERVEGNTRTEPRSEYLRFSLEETKTLSLTGGSHG